ncbi:uncharacterized protein GGS25DRAFT_429922 [Hypoxylon fragiforme]|uniref:uncharacterized protein n=1 Tax=Hypoxylon fragiforme TaxID=63214 RepID=UPI0020C63498|nr:uncharacterized protein GGS25DRAFT_429922 [Hypoxylon fragiforme]KAI2605427.1 hypothetical protein GGS25DRAFT_429922 [Hypoxylon fragiforme]
MNEGSYNNVIRSSSPFSPATPNPGAYKANVNRTKTRKWVEAKVQNYDGDDWGNEYEDEYDEFNESNQEPQPSAATLRPPQPRTFSQPQSTADPSAASGLTGTRNAQDVPPSLHVQTSVNPRTRPFETVSSAQSSSGSARFPLRQSSKTADDNLTPSALRSGTRAELGSAAPPWLVQRENSAGSSTSTSQLVRPSDIYRRVGEDREKERISMESSRPSMDSAQGRNSRSSSPSKVSRLVAEHNQGNGFGSHTNPDTSLSTKQSLAPVEERVTANAETGALNDETKSFEGLVNPPRLSTSPKLPDLTRLSGFGDDLFSSSGKHISLHRRSVAQNSDSQNTNSTDTRPDLSARSEDKQGDHVGRSERNHPSSVLEGPKLEPNPDIIMPSLEAKPEPQKENYATSSQYFTQSRPQLPGTWVSETVTPGPERLTPAEKEEGPKSTPLGSIANRDGAPISSRHAEPADLEPTTTVRQLPSANDDSKATAKTIAVGGVGEDGFNNPTGKHDDEVASKVIAAGPGLHPTPQSLPPLKTERSVNPSHPAQNVEQEAPISSTMLLSPSTYKKPPPHSLSAHGSAAPAGPEFTLTAPLNPRRSIAAPPDLVTSGIEERIFTTSAGDSASPEKESDKLSEEIIKSLSSSTTSPDAGAVLGSSPSDAEPAPGRLTRESTYLSGVYDDYLAMVDDKSLQETGQVLRQGSRPSYYGPDDTEAAHGSDLQKENVFPDIAPLSSRRSPVQEPTKRERRFSWEDSREKAGNGSSESKPPSSALSYGSNSAPQVETSLAPATETEKSISSALLQAPSDETIKSPQTDGQAPIDSSLTLLEPSPIIRTATEPAIDKQSASPEPHRLSLADEKEQILEQSVSDTPSADQHPALASTLQSTPDPSTTAQTVPSSQSMQQIKPMAFRDILNIVSTEHRIQKFDETRSQFYAMESGLSAWIAYMQSLPEHATGGKAGGVLAQGQMSPSSMTPNQAQQPYYQQYLAASHPGAPMPQLGRSNTGSLQQTPTGQPASSFGNNNQVGAKSKEFLHAAGAFGNKGMKSGMKLFAKGKNKLRGTGDKVFF